MSKIIAVDAENCTGCRVCELVCSVVKTGCANPARSRIHVIKWDETGIRLPMLCVHCAQAPCMACCPVDALSRNDRTGAVERVPDLCIGCTMCVSACPFGAMSLDPHDDLAVNCDLCGGTPECVAACPHGALLYAEAGRVALAKKRARAARTAEALET
jgi:Fe-S-cluster-containing hydrogenase component 2